MRTSTWAKILVLMLILAMLSGCGEEKPPETTAPAETETQPVETEPVIDEKSATVISQLNIRSAPGAHNTLMGTLVPGTVVTVYQQSILNGVVYNLVRYVSICSVAHYCGIFNKYCLSVEFSYASALGGVTGYC